MLFLIAALDDSRKKERKNQVDPDKKEQRRRIPSGHRCVHGRPLRTRVQIPAGSSGGHPRAQPGAT